MYWTHFTLPLSDLDGSIKFFTEVCGLSVVRDRRLEGGSTVWLGPKPAQRADPEFALVACQGEVMEPGFTGAAHRLTCFVRPHWSRQ